MKLYLLLKKNLITVYKFNYNKMLYIFNYKIICKENIQKAW